MPRKSLTGSLGESPTLTVRLAPAHRRALRELSEAWGCTWSEALRRAVLEAHVREVERAETSGA